MREDIIEAMKRAGYDYRNMSIKELQKTGVKNAELVYETIQAEKRGLSYGQYVSLKDAGLLPT